MYLKAEMQRFFRPYHARIVEKHIKRKIQMNQMENDDMVRRGMVINRK